MKFSEMEPAMRAELAALVYELSCVNGGNLHIIIEDYNTEDHWVDEAHEWIDENRWGADPGQLAEERRCLELLRMLDEDERDIAIMTGHVFTPPRSFLIRGSFLVPGWDAKGQEGWTP